MRHLLRRPATTRLLPLTLLFLAPLPGVEAQDSDPPSTEKTAPESAADSAEAPLAAEAEAPPSLAFVKSEEGAPTGEARSFAPADVTGDRVPEILSLPLRLPGIETDGATALAAADFDNDGDLDLLVTRSAGHANLLLENVSAGGAEAASFAVAAAGELGKALETDSVAACWGDFDNDGLLDVFVVNAHDQDDLLYRNRGDRTFERAREGVVVGNGGDGRACAAGDMNDDGALDLYVGNFADGKQGAENFLYLNRGDGRFVERPFSIAVSDRGYTSGASLVDYDYDLDLDLFVANAGPGDTNALYLNDGTARFSEIFESPLAGDGQTRSGGHTWGDFDNDGHLDLYLANGWGTESGQPNQLFLADGRLSFAAAQGGDAVAASEVSMATASADFDRDGDLDLFVADQRGSVRYDNPTAYRSWLELRLQGRDSNRMGLGARVTIQARVDRKNLQITRWLLSANAQSEPVLRFGFGERGRPVEMEIAWPSGRVDTHTDLRPRRAYLAVEGGELIEQ